MTRASPSGLYNLSRLSRLSVWWLRLGIAIARFIELLPPNCRIEEFIDLI